MKKLKAKIEQIQKWLYTDTTVTVLFLISLGLFIVNAFCNLGTAANFLAGSASFMAAFLILRVAKSADDSSRKALEMNKKIIDLEIMKEGPAIYLMTKDYIPSGYDRQFRLKNLGSSPAINISCELFTPVNDYPLLPDIDGTSSRDLTCKLANEPVFPNENSTKEYEIRYENLFGKKFITKFKMTEYDNNAGNLINPRRITIYKVKDQKIVIDD
jgi:hypothetical protein